MSELRIERVVTLQQARAWQLVHNAIIPTHPLSVLQIHERAERNRLFTAHLGDVLVGCSTVRPPDEDTTRATVIARILPAHRRRGLGTRLHRHGLAQAHFLGGDGIETCVLASNREGVLFALAAGYEETERYLLPGDTVPYVVLVLPQRLRPARPEEAGELSALALRSKGHRGYDEAFLSACREELTLRPEEVEKARTLVAEQDGRIVGFATLHGEPPVGELAMLFVDPPAIGRGIGTMLHDRITATAARAGFTHLTVTADPHAESFYLARGGRRTGTAPSGSIPGRELPLLTIDL